MESNRGFKLPKWFKWVIIFFLVPGGIPIVLGRIALRLEPRGRLILFCILTICVLGIVILINRKGITKNNAMVEGMERIFKKVKFIENHI